MDEGQIKTMRLLRQLVGMWSGYGMAEYPTIRSTEYREELEFMANDAQPLLRYEQRTWKRRESGEVVPSHWETGYWRVRSENEIELVCAQGGGCVEVSRGTLTPTLDGFTVCLHSTHLANDARLGQTAREYAVRSGSFHYSVEMSTTIVTDLTAHLHAELKRGQGWGAAL